MSKMSQRDNLLSLYRRQGYDYAPVSFSLCKSQQEQFTRKTGQTDYAEYFGFPYRYAKSPAVIRRDPAVYHKYYGALKEGTTIDVFGIGHEKGSDAAFHMTRMLHPLRNAGSTDDILSYEFPEFYTDENVDYAGYSKSIREAGLAVAASLQCTVWEIAWYIRGMDELMVDMVEENEMAEVLFDKITQISCSRIAHYTKCGADLILLGDDIGMQRSIMMSVDMYRRWIAPRHKKIIKTAKEINPDVLIHYHSCGYIEPFIDDLIDAGIDILNPVQPECMDFADIFEKYGGKISFNGTLGTQSTLPFGKPEDVRETVNRNLKIAGEYGGLLCCPTHLVEPEVPWENILAYADACKCFK